jgi:putative transposase
VSNDNPYSKSLFRTAKYRPDYPRRPFASKEVAYWWMASFVDWYNQRQRHSGIKFMTPQQRHSGQAVEICHHQLASTNRGASETHAAGHDQRVAGVNPRWSG